STMLNYSDCNVYFFTPPKWNYIAFSNAISQTNRFPISHASKCFLTHPDTAKLLTMNRFAKRRLI
ncbi:MAG: hypothetical protein WCO51_13725, partial [bacterium]